MTLGRIWTIADGSGTKKVTKTLSGPADGVLAENH